MFNRVMLAGRLTKAPEPVHTPERGTEMELTVDHVPRWGDGKVENCQVRVRVLGAKRAEIMERWMEAGRPIQISGHLGFDDKGLLVEAEQWQFMNDDVVSFAIGAGEGAKVSLPQTPARGPTHAQAEPRVAAPAAAPPGRRQPATVGAGFELPGAGHAF